MTGQKYYINLYGPNSYEGTVELSDGLSWYTLHQQGWNDRNAEVTCRMLGYYGVFAVATFGSLLPTITRPVWEFQFHCNGNETTLSECQTNRLNSTAGHTSVGVRCPSHPVVEYRDFLLRRTTDNKISKVNAETMSGTVNTNTGCFTDISGEIVYDKLYDRIIYFKNYSLWGCRFGGRKIELYRFGSGIWITSLALDKDDRILFYLSHDAIFRLMLDDTSAVPIRVLNNTGAISLTVETKNKNLYWLSVPGMYIERVGYDGTSRAFVSAISHNGFASISASNGSSFWSDSRMEGITKVYFNDSTESDFLFAGVTTCNPLYVVGQWIYCVTYSGVLRLEKNGKCGSDHGPIAEASKQIVQFNDEPTTYKEPMCENFYITLYGIQPHEGTVELSNGIGWQTLCSDGWDDNNAAVACRMLGYSGIGARAIFNTSSANKAAFPWRYQFHCKGDENVLSECSTSSHSSPACYRAGVRCSQQKVVPDFFLKRTTKGTAKTNPFTMSRSIILNNQCKFEHNHDVIYDSVNDQFLSFKNGSLWGCRWAGGYTEIRKNIIELSFPALDSEQRLLFGYWNNDIVSLRLDDVSADLVVVVNGTTVGNKLVLDTERNEIYWWEISNNFHSIRRVSYDGGSEAVCWGSHNPLRTMTFKGDSLYFIDPQHPGVFRKHRNGSTYPMYQQFGMLSDKCGNLYADHEWIYCTGYFYYSWRILRLQNDGKGGNLIGPLEYSRSAFQAEIPYHHSSM